MGTDMESSLKIIERNQFVEIFMSYDLYNKSHFRFVCICTCVSKGIENYLNGY